MTYLIVGGSAGLGRALAERFAEGGEDLVLVSSDIRDTQALARDLTLRYGVNVLPAALDLSVAAPSFSSLDELMSGMTRLSGILLPAGANSADDRAGTSHADFDALIHANFTSICKLVERYIPLLALAESGVVVGFGSVAAVRGRTRNAAYAASKRALESYFESLRHALGSTAVRVQFYVVGYLDTNLAFGARTLLPRAAPQHLAQRVFESVHADFGRAFYPSYWRVVCMILRALPWAVFRRLSF